MGGRVWWVLVLAACGPAVSGSRIEAGGDVAVANTAPRSPEAPEVSTTSSTTIPPPLMWGPGDTISGRMLETVREVAGIAADPTTGGVIAITVRPAGSWLTKYDASFNEVWSQRIGEADLRFPRSAVAVDSSGSSFSISGEVLRKFSSNGSLLWTVTTGAARGVAVDRAGNAVLLTDASVSKYTPDGEPEWTVGLDRPGGIATDAAGNVVVGSFDTVVEFDARGQRLWTTNVRASDRWTQVGMVGVAPDGSVVAISDESCPSSDCDRFYRTLLDAKGAVAARTQIGVTFGPNNMAIDPQGFVVTTLAFDGSACSLSSVGKRYLSGDPHWSRQFLPTVCHDGGGPGLASVAIAANGDVILAGVFTKATDFGTGEVSPSSPPQPEGVLLRLAP
jgi:hypothetical protein